MGCCNNWLIILLVIILCCGCGCGNDNGGLFNNNSCCG